MSNLGALAVFGSGPGVGRNVAALFAERGFEKIILLSRNATRLAEDAAFVRNACSDAAEIYETTVDLSTTQSVKQSLHKIEEALDGTPLRCVLFNAARTGKSEFFAFESDHLENDLRITIVSLYTGAQWAMPRLLDSASSSPTGASFLVTSGMLAKDPFPTMFALAASKAGQYSLVHSLHKEFEPKGVHCGLIVIGGFVSEKSKVTNPRNIAEECWNMFEQPKGKGNLEVSMMDPAYEEHVENRGK